jgi:hypothetical protein
MSDQQDFNDAIPYLRDIARLPGLIESCRVDEAIEILEGLLSNVFASPLPPTGAADALDDWQDVAVEVCCTFYKRGLRQARYDQSTDGSFDSLVGCIRLLPVLIGARLDEVDTGVPTLRVPIQQWCVGFEAFTHRSQRPSDKQMDYLFPVGEAQC